MSDKNYTTKPVELPLSTDKEYVLIDIEKHKSFYGINKFIVSDLEINKPFKLDEVDSAGFGRLSDKFVISNLAAAVIFEEVIRETPTHQMVEDNGEIEWRNGDRCVYVGCEYTFVGMAPTFSDVSCIIFDSENGIEHVSINKLRKPESEVERIERGRNNAIYEMCSAVDNFTEDSRFWAGKFHDAGYHK